MEVWTKHGANLSDVIFEYFQDYEAGVRAVDTNLKNQKKVGLHILSCLM